MDNQQSLLKQLNSRINALKIISRNASFKSRLMLASGTYLAKLVYLIQLWGGTSENFLNALQVTQNKVMKIVTKSSWFTPTRLLLRQCNWLSVRQLVSYHTALSTHKIATTGLPQYHAEKMCSSHSHNTRATVKFAEKFTGKQSLTANSFCYRGATQYNRLPLEITQIANEVTFKKKLKEWIKRNIQIK